MEKIRSKNHKNYHMGRSKTDNLVKCKKHPKHQQSPGVCSVCLREKLSQLSSNTRKNAISTVSTCSSLSSSSLSSLTSSNASSCSSPVHRSRFAGVEAGKRYVSFLKSGKSVFLTKSRSMAYDLPMREGVVDQGKKKNGFWSKLIHKKSKRVDEGLVHSKTMRERGTSRIH